MGTLKIVNRKARYEYEFLEELEAGIVLTGTEIKSVRAGKVSFKDSHARILEGEVWLFNLHISPYEKGTYANHEPERKRKLLLTRHEIDRLDAKVTERGLSLVPACVYINEKGLAKVALALARGKHTFDKSESIQRREQELDLKRRLKEV